MKQYEEMPSGKIIMRDLDKGGCITAETHRYGMLDIAIKTEFIGGKKSCETYFLKRRIVSRKSYVKACAEYSDMPPPDEDLEDFGGELLKDMRAERRQRQKAAEVHSPNPDVARQVDAFCCSMLESGESANAKNWIEASQHTLGEYEHEESRQIIDKLIELGSMRVNACDIESDDDGYANTGHLVVELPNDPECRKRILGEVDRLASSHGFSGDFDDGQCYTYILLD